MSEFRTILKQERAKRLIALKDAVLTTGSCFADAMGQRFIKNKFQCSSNPFGAVYNPVSIHHALEDALTRRSIAGSSFVESQQRSVNYNYHSQWNASSEGELKTMLEAQLTQVHDFLTTASVLIITYGTAWVYNRKDTGDIVANCHKLPAAMFTKQLLTVEAIVESFHSFHNILKRHNPNCRTIITVSPVRHIKDTLELNGASKAVLRTAAHVIAQQFDNVEYFPAYEIMIDDLRDYRFYKSDMIHPTEDAEEYIWKAFATRYFDNETLNFIKNWEEITNALKHRPFHAQSAAHQEFLKNLLTKLKKLHHLIDVGKEISEVESQITGI